MVRPEEWWVACPLVAAELLAALPVELAPAAGMLPPMTSATAGPASPAATRAVAANPVAPCKRQLITNQQRASQDAQVSRNGKSALPLPVIPTHTHAEICDES